jgi:hypothetical protein
MTLREEALKLADDIDEYAPNTNIADILRRLVAENDRLKGKTDLDIDGRC